MRKPEVLRSYYQLPAKQTFRNNVPGDNEAKAREPQRKLARKSDRSVHKIRNGAVVPYALRLLPKAKRLSLIVFQWLTRVATKQVEYLGVNGAAVL